MEGRSAARAWVTRAFACAVNSDESWMRALPSGEVAISTARRRLSCRTGRSAAVSEKTARKIEQTRKLSLLVGVGHGRAKTCRGKTAHAPDGPLNVGFIAQPA